MKFKVLLLQRKLKPYFVFVRKLGEGDFVIPENPMLDDIPIKGLLLPPRALKPDGTPDLDIYTFKLHRPGVDALKVDQIVELRCGSSSWEAQQ